MTQAPAQNRPNLFRQLTRQLFIQQPSQSASSYSQVLNFNIPPNGYLANIYLKVTGSFTVPGSPSGNWASYPPLPFALIKRIRLYTSETVTPIDISGWGLTLWNMMQKRTHSPGTDIVSYLNANSRAALLTTQTGALSASTVSFSTWYKVPVMTDEIMMLGMLLLQTLDVRCTLEVTVAAAADFVSSGGSTLTSPSWTITPTVEYYTVPNDSASQPNQNYVHLLQEDNFPYTNLGDVPYPPVIGNTYLSFGMIAENNGAQVAPNVGSGGINSVVVQYAQSVRPYNEDYISHLIRLKDYLGITPPDGTIWWDFKDGSGLPGLNDLRDWFNTSQQTDLRVIPNITGLTLTNANLRVIKEQLAAIG